jgi:hypothetical protein
MSEADAVPTWIVIVALVVALWAIVILASEQE